MQHTALVSESQIPTQLLPSTGTARHGASRTRNFYNYTVCTVLITYEWMNYDTVYTGRVPIQ